MTKQQKENFDDLYDFSSLSNKEKLAIKEQEKINKKKAKEREKRINQRKKEQEAKFDFDTETVIGMTNRNNQKETQQNNTKKKMQKEAQQNNTKKKMQKEAQQKNTKKKMQKEAQQKNIKKQTQKSKQARIERKKKKIKRIIKWIALLLIIIGGIVFALVSPIFNVTEIQVINNNQISAETIVSLSQLQIGQNLFKFSKGKVEKEIKTNPYIENIDIKRKIPNKIEISVKERIRNYNIEFLNGYAYINNQGYILEISEQKLDLPVIQGISTEQEQIVEGNRLNTEDLEKLETVIKIMNICKDYELEQKVSTIDITDKSNYIIYMEQEKKTIYLGDESNLNNKMLYIPTILQENVDKEGTIYLNGDLNNGFKPRFREKV